MPYTPAHTHAAPFKDLNVTPFIDVLLVLIIMLIMTIPILTNVTEVELPSPVGGKESNPTINVVSLTARDQILWNGEPVDPGTLQSSIARARTMPVEPVLRFAPTPKTIKVGDTVEFRNVSAFVHTVSTRPANAAEAASVSLPKGAKAFDSGEIAAGGIYRHTFTVPGTYKYFCDPHHGVGMVGTIVVTG